jgi:hypothetical protein
MVKSVGSRRDFISLLAGAAAALPFCAQAQPAARARRFLGDPSPQPLAYRLRAYKRTGSIEGDSNVLRLSEASSFKPGDQVVVEVGGEEGMGQFGTIGVGGILPATDHHSQFYYRSKDLPLALISRVKVVAHGGRTLLLDKAAATSATNANVHFDNHPLLKKILAEEHPPGWRVTLPAGDFAISDKLQHMSQGGWIISGVGRDVTILRSPKGVPGGGLHCVGTNDTEIRDFSIVGNAGQNGFGLKHHTNGSFEYSVGVLLTKSSNCVVRNVACVDVFRKAVWGEYTNNLRVQDCDLTINDPFRGYLDWWFGVSDGSNSTFTRCRIDSKYLIPGFETFRSDGVKFIDCGGKNACFASNSSGNFLLDGFTLRIAAGAQFDEQSFHHRNPLVNINSNIQPPNDAMAMGGLIRNTDISVEGPIDTVGNLIAAIVINRRNPSVTVNGGIIRYPDGRPGAEIGPFGVNSTGANTIIRNLTVTGKVANSWEANIYVRDGIVSNCTAERIRVDKTSQ